MHMISEENFKFDCFYIEKNTKDYSSILIVRVSFVC